MSMSAYLSFTRALRQLFDQAGIKYETDPTSPTGVSEVKKWVEFRFAPEDGGPPHKLYVPKNVGAVGACHTTVLFSTDIEGVLELPTKRDGTPYRNGAIRSHLSGDDPERLARLMIGALRRGAPAPTRRLPQPRTAQQTPRAHAEAPVDAVEASPENVVEDEGEAALAQH